MNPALNDTEKIIELRRTIHSRPSLAEDETATVATLTDFIAPYKPDRVLAGIGGTGVAFVFEAPEPGPTVLFRSELDCVPVAEKNSFSHCSSRVGLSHSCGHDGHMAIVSGLAPWLVSGLIKKGRVVLFFQAAEETGEGAERAIDDKRFAEIAPDFVFALHNLPGFPLGQVIVREGLFSCASTGMVAALKGVSAHAAHPEQARCPALAMAEIIQNLLALPTRFDFFTLVTVIHARLGEVAFGTTPGYAEIMATFRADGDDRLRKLLDEAQGVISKSAVDHGLDHDISWRDPFAATVNHPQALRLVEKAARAIGADLVRAENPFRWSDDFGQFTARFPGAMFGLGAGVDHSPLHSPYYDFPDELIMTGVGLFEEIIRELLG